MNKKFLCALLIIATLQTISYGFPYIEVELQGPEEFKFNFEGASIVAPRSPQSGNVSSLDESQRGTLKTWIARRNNDIVNSFDLELPTSRSSLNRDNLLYLNFYKNNVKISPQPVRIDLNLENNEVNLGEYTINIKVSKTEPGPDVKYNIQMSARRNS